MHPIVSFDTFVAEGAQTVALSKRRQMVQLTTESGRTLIMTPETVFALEQRGGHPLLDCVCRVQSVSHAKWARFRDPCYSVISNHDYRLWYILGLSYTTGGAMLRSHLACRVVLPGGRMDEIAVLADFLDRYQTIRKLRDAYGRPWEVTIRQSGPTIVLVSRVIDLIRERLVPEGTSIRDAYAALNAEGKRGFVAGFIAGMPFIGGTRGYAHRDSTHVRWLNRILFWDFGIPTKLNINPFEPTVLAHASPRRMKNPHHLLLEPQAMPLVLAAQVDVPGLVIKPIAGTSYMDPFTKAERLGLVKANEIRGAGPVHNVGGFLMRSDFEPSGPAIEIASMPELFTDVRDPDEVLANAPATMTHLHGAV